MKVTQIKIFEAPSWCIPCRQFEPVVKTAREMEIYKDINFEVIDLDEEGSDEIAKEYNIRSIPCSVFLDANNEVLTKVTGAVSVKTFCDTINNFSDGES